MKKKKTLDPLDKFRKHDYENNPDSQENIAALVIGGRRHGGSGSSPWMKSDASSDRFQVECKQTCKDSMSIKLEWLRKITNEAAGKSKDPVLNIQFNGAEIGLAKSWYCVPDYLFKELIK